MKREKLKIDKGVVGATATLAVSGFLIFLISMPHSMELKRVAESGGSSRAEIGIEDLDDERKFEPGEHIISITIDETDIDQRDFYNNKNINFPYYDGYSFIGVSWDRDTITLLYVNTETVWCTATGTDKAGNLVYTEFGTAEVSSKEEPESDNCQYFDEGQHIIGIPITEPNENQQYDYHEGYEIVGFTHCILGKTVYSGGYVVYVNTVPVNCEKTEEGFVDFGTPVEETLVNQSAKTLVLR